MHHRYHMGNFGTSWKDWVCIFVPLLYNRLVNCITNTPGRHQTYTYTAGPVQLLTIWLLSSQTHPVHLLPEYSPDDNKYGPRSEPLSDHKPLLTSSEMIHKYNAPLFPLEDLVLHNHEVTLLVQLFTASHRLSHWNVRYWQGLK